MCESCLERNKVYVNTKLYFECVTPREKCVDTFDWHFKQYAIYWLQYSFWLVRVDFMCGKIRGALGVWHLWDVCQLCKGGCKAVEQKKKPTKYVDKRVSFFKLWWNGYWRFMCFRHLLVKANSRPNLMYIVPSSCHAKWIPTKGRLNMLD